MFCFCCILFPSLNPVLPLPSHLNCSLKNDQLIPLCQTKSLPSILTLSDLQADHPLLQNSSLAWHPYQLSAPSSSFCFPTLGTCPRFSFLIIFTALHITSVQVLSLTSHLRLSPMSRYLYQNDELLVLKLLFLISLHILLISMLFYSGSKPWK